MPAWERRRPAGELLNASDGVWRNTSKTWTAF